MSMVFRVLCFLIVLVLCQCFGFDEFDDEDELCTLPEGEPGVCINLHSCKPLLDLNRGKVSNPFTTWLLNKAHCGFDGNFPKTCCPVYEDDDYSNNIDVTIKPTTTVNVRTTAQPSKTNTKTTLAPPKRGKLNWISLGETCTTIYNTTGSCSDIHHCKPLLAMMKEAHYNPAVARLVKQAHCGFSGTIPTVCCPLPGQTSSPVIRKPATSNRSREHFLDSFPEPPVCGVSAVVPTRVTVISRVAGGVPAKLGSFPWMALLAYREDSLSSGVRWQCGGSLISSRHVLTSAHCIHLREDKLFLVRLGELDLAREDEGATPIDVFIKKMIKHEQYTRNKPVMYDIGVLMLDRDVEFTALIKPICLVPDKKWRSSNFEAHKPVVAGWGNTKWMGVRATHLQVAQLPVVNNGDCEKVYSRYFSKSQMFSKQAMCAGFAEGQVNTCAGDSGGPLMLLLPTENSKSLKHYFYEIGVVSFGSMCGVTGSPGVYTRVAAYMPWLEEKVLGRTRPS